MKNKPRFWAHLNQYFLITLALMRNCAPLLFPVTATNMNAKYLKLIFKVVFIHFSYCLFGQPGIIEDYNHIKYEYQNLDSSDKTPLIICIPGFTQHNRSQEFLTLKDYFSRNGFSYLIMNPPQHGEEFTWFKKLYSWGEAEVGDLIELSNYLQIWQKHSEIHLMGFSIGAKIVLKFSAEPKYSDSIKSVIAIAAPFRVGDINVRISGDIVRISEGLISSFHAMRRAGFRVPYMALAGMPKGLFINRASPANEIPLIKAPSLLIHGSDDWLTKSYHSAKLFECAKDSSQFSLVILNTRTHAEDMLSRGETNLKTGFMEIVDNWFKFIKKGNLPNNKKLFNEAFGSKLKSNPKTKDILFPAKKVTFMSSPAYNELNSNIWMTPADFNHSLFTLNSIFTFNKNNLLRHFFTFGSNKLHGSFYDRFRLGFSFEQGNSDTFSNYETYLSVYYPFGSIIWLRRLSYIGGIGNSFNRKILSADLAFLVLDFQINYGRFVDKKNDWQLALNFPLVGNGSGSYFLGVGYSRFMSSISPQRQKDNFKFYLFIGPGLKWNNSRVQLTLQYDTNGISKNSNNILSSGISINFRER